MASQLVPLPRGTCGTTARRVRPLLVAGVAAVLLLPAAGPAAADSHEPGLGDVLEALAPDEGEASPSPSPEESAAPDDDAPAAAPTEEPAPDAPAGEQPPEAAAEPAPTAAPAEVQASTEQQPASVAPRGPRSGSSAGPRLQAGEVPDAPAPAPFPDAQPPLAAGPEVAPPEGAPSAGTGGPGVAAQLAMAPRPPLADEPVAPELAFLGFVALALAWYDRRHRARYRLPPA